MVTSPDDFIEFVLTEKNLMVEIADMSILVTNCNGKFFVTHFCIALDLLVSVAKSGQVSFVL